MVVLREEDIQAIADAVVAKIKPLLFPVKQGEPVEVEIARVQASGQDMVRYLKERWRQGKERERREKIGIAKETGASRRRKGPTRET